MTFSDDLCQLVIKNLQIVEDAPLVVSQIDQVLLSAINQRIEKRVNSDTDWPDGCFDQNPVDDETETSFHPSNWLKKSDNGNMECYAFYQLDTYGNIDSDYWSSYAIGLEGRSLALTFRVNYKELDIKTKFFKNKLAELDKNDLIAANCFIKGDTGDYYYRQITLSADLLAEEYPDLDKVLAPIDKALDDLFKAHTVFDDFVQKLLKEYNS